MASSLLATDKPAPCVPSQVSAQTEAHLTQTGQCFQAFLFPLRWCQLDTWTLPITLHHRDSMPPT